MTQRYHSTHEDLAMLPANDGVYVLFCDYEALRTELAQCQRERDEARMSLDNRQQEVDRLILEQSHTYAVEIPELEQQLAQCQRERDSWRNMNGTYLETMQTLERKLEKCQRGLKEARRTTLEEVAQRGDWLAAHAYEYDRAERHAVEQYAAWCREQSAKEQP